MKPRQLSNNDKIFLELFRSRSVLYYCMITKERSRDIKNIIGKVNVLLITKEAIGEKLQMRPEKDQKEIGYIHIGRIQLIVKAPS